VPYNLSRVERNFAFTEPRFDPFNHTVTEQKKSFGADRIRGVANVEAVTARKDSLYRNQ